MTHEAILLFGVPLLPVHIGAGALAILGGAVALIASKGGPLHRRSGVLFVCAMIVMTASAVCLGIARDQRFNAMQGALALYLVATAFMTVRRNGQRYHWFEPAAAVFAVAVAGYDFMLGMEAMQRPRRSMDGVPAAMIFIFGALALMAAAGDVRATLARTVNHRRRIARHLWRMSFALWIATASFFLGQAKIIPEPLRIMPLLAVPVVLVMVMMVYWLVRVLYLQRSPALTRQNQP
jgi:uncharacterized membrane protein